MVDLNLTIFIITLNANGLNTPIKRQRSDLRGKKKQGPTICYLKKLTLKTQIDGK